jgi:hypothetical protein
MKDHSSPGDPLDQRFAGCMLEVLIRSGIILALTLLGVQVFLPFQTLLVWALILAVASYPLHQALARKMGGKQGLAATLQALGYQLFMGWFADRSDAKLPPANAYARQVQ